MASPRNIKHDRSRVVEGDALRRLQVPLPGAALRAVVVSHLGLLVAFAMPLVVPSAPAYAIAILLAVGVQTRLAVLMHEAAHGLLHRDRRRNDRLGNWLAAFAIGTTVETYRANHLQHHANLGTPQDPDFTTLCMPPIRRGLAASVVGCLTGLRHAQLVRKYLGLGAEATAGERSDARVSLLGRIVWQGALLGGCAAAGQPLVYFVVWVLPLFTVSVLINELRSVVEHTPLLGGADEPLPSITRTVRAGWIGRTWIGPLNFNYHLEHHLHPRVPFSRLRELHELLVERGHYDLRPELLCDGYGQVLRAVWQRYRRPRTRPRITIEDGTYVVQGG